MAINAGTGLLSGSSYGDLSKHDAYTIQKRMLPIAKRLLTFAKFAQRKPATERGFGDPAPKIRTLPDWDTPWRRAFLQTSKPPAHQSMFCSSTVHNTDIMLAASHDPIVQVITERQAQQAGETIDFISYGNSSRIASRLCTQHRKHWTQRRKLTVRTRTLPLTAATTLLTEQFRFWKTMTPPRSKSS